MHPGVRWLLEQQRQRQRLTDTSDWSRKVERVLSSCHPKQRAFASDPSTRIVALCGARAGKTTGGRARFLNRMLTTPGADCLFIAPTVGVAHKLMWNSLREADHELGLGAKFHDTLPYTMELPKNGSVLTLTGANDRKQIEKQRGIPRHEVGIDEVGSYPTRLIENLIEQVIEPRLGDYDGTLWIAGTPVPQLRGLFYDVSRPGTARARPWDDRELPQWAGWEGWSLHRWSMRDGAPYVPEIGNAWRIALAKKAREGWSDEHPIWRREYEGQWSADDTERIFKYRPHADDGSPWNQWDPERIHRDVLPDGVAKLPPGDWTYVYCADLGYSDSFALNVLAYERHGRDLFHVACIDRKRLYAQQMALILLGQNWVTRIMAGQDPGKPGGLVGITGWPAAAVADNSGKGQAILDELANVYGFKFTAAERRDKHDNIELLNGDFVDGRVKVLKGSKLEEQLCDLQWTVDDYGKLTEPQGAPNDHTDSVIYGRRAAKHQFVEEPPGPEPTPRAREAQRMDEIEERAARVPDPEYDWLDDAWGN